VAQAQAPTAKDAPPPPPPPRGDDGAAPRPAIDKSEGSATRADSAKASSKRPKKIDVLLILEGARWATLADTQEEVSAEGSRVQLPLGKQTLRFLVDGKPATAEVDVRAPTDPKKPPAVTARLRR
jgi:hypothetical protein